MRLHRALLGLLLVFSPAFAQQQVVNTGTGPNSGNGDNLRTAGTKINSNFSQWFNLNGIAKGTNGGAPTVASSSDIIGLFTGCSGSLLLGADGACHNGSGNPAFSAVTSGSNTSASMTVGTGASLGTTGSGTISATTATALSATPSQCSGQVSTGVTAAGNCNGTSTPTLGASGTLGTITLGNATSGTVTILPPTGALGTLNITLPNASGTLLYSGGPGGTPSSLNLSNATALPCAALPSFTGDVTFSSCGTTVSKVNGVAVPANATVLGTNSSAQPAAATTTGAGSTVVLATSPALTTPTVAGYATASLPTCNSGSKGALAYTTDGTPSFSFCNGTNWVNTGGTTFTMVGTGCTPTAATGDATGGTFTLASGPCTAVTVTFNGAVGMTAGHLWDCNIHDETLQAAGTWFGSWGNTPSGTPTVSTVIPIPTAAGATDVIYFSCAPH